MAEIVGGVKAAGECRYIQALVFRLELVEATDNSLTFRVPNNIYQFWIESNHMSALQAAIVDGFWRPACSKVFFAVGALQRTLVPKTQPL